MGSAQGNYEHFLVLIWLDMCHCSKNLLLFTDIEVSKVLYKIAKEKDCEELLPLIKPCVTHLCWSAMSTIDGNGEVIWAKFQSFLEHVANVQSNLPNPIFDYCAHEEGIAERTWLNKGIIFMSWS